MIGTSDQSCWLAEACKILLLLLPLYQQTSTAVGLPRTALTARRRYLPKQAHLKVSCTIYSSRHGMP